VHDYSTIGGRVDVKLKDTGTHAQTLTEALESVLGSNLGSSSVGAKLTGQPCGVLAPAPGWRLPR